MTNRLRRSSIPGGTVLANTGPKRGPAAAVPLKTLITQTASAIAKGLGTVTSVGLSVPAQFSVASSPITSSGTISVSWANQNANLVFAGPSSGAAAAPGFRVLVNADLPTPGVAAGTYGDATHVGQFTVNAQGIITAASDVAITGGGGGSTYLIDGTGAPSAIKPAGTIYAQHDGTAGARIWVSQGGSAGNIGSGSSTTSTGQLTLSAIPTVGDLIIAWLGCQNNPASVINTSKWTVATQGGGASNAYIVCVYRYVQAGDTATLPPITTGSVSFGAAIAVEVSGVTGTWATDFERSGAKYDQLVSSLSMTALTTSHNNDLVLLGVFNYDGNANMSGGAGFSLDVNTHNFANYGAWIMAHDLVVASGTNVSTSFTTATSANPSGYIAVIINGGAINQIGSWTAIAGV